MKEDWGALEDQAEQAQLDLDVDAQLVPQPLAAAQNKEADAVGAVRVAEAKLAELYDSGTAKSSQLVAAEERVARAERALQLARGAVAEVNRQLRDAAEAAPEAADADPPLEPVCASLAVFVVEVLAPMYRRQLGHGRTWCPDWFKHPEATARLEAMWRAWEHLRLDPATGMSVWFRDHADHHMGVLLDPDGPLKGCSPDSGHSPRPLAPLPCNRTTPGLYDDGREAP